MVPQADIRHGLGSITEVFGSDCLFGRIYLFSDAVEPIRPPRKCDVVRNVRLFLSNLGRLHLKFLHEYRQDSPPEHQDRNEERSAGNQQREVASEDGRDKQDGAKPQGQRKRLCGREPSVDIGIGGTNHPVIPGDQDVIRAKPHRHPSEGNQSRSCREQMRPHQACPGVEVEADTLERRVH